MERKAAVVEGGFAGAYLWRQNRRYGGMKIRQECSIVKRQLLDVLLGHCLALRGYQFDLRFDWGGGICDHPPTPIRLRSSSTSANSLSVSRSISFHLASHSSSSLVASLPPSYAPVLATADSLHRQ
ncbi:unnamed protein product [Nezara viridula]|uniref:Uncharacterized protein n=1 Tax=Nezara viridula TaxID=85310 RepID=A0A9P0MX14_NEZVI|nr:unnamed protein product [Nezara viridula]